MNDIQKAIERLKSCSIIPFDEDSAEVCGLAIVALQEKAEREAGCEYCDFSSGDVGATLNNCGDDFVLIRSEDGISIATDDKHFKMVGVKFCPNCGRDLRKR